MCAYGLTCNYCYSLYLERTTVGHKCQTERELLNMCCFARVVNKMSNSSTYMATRPERKTQEISNEKARHSEHDEDMKLPLKFAVRTSETRHPYEGKTHPVHFAKR